MQESFPISSSSKLEKSWRPRNPGGLADLKSPGEQGLGPLLAQHSATKQCQRSRPQTPMFVGDDGPFRGIDTAVEACQATPCQIDMVDDQGKLEK